MAAAGTSTSSPRSAELTPRLSRLTWEPCGLESKADGFRSYRQTRVNVPAEDPSVDRAQPLAAPDFEGCL